MATVTLKGDQANTCGELPAVGADAPDFTLSAADLSQKSLSDWKGQRLVLNIFPSVDTPTCALSVKRFNSELSKLSNTAVLCISRDLPFAQKRFCGAEELESVVTLSMYRDDSFGKSYGIELVDGPLAGLFARAVVIVDENGKVTYTELVPEIADEPNYEAALAALG